MTTHLSKAWTDWVKGNLNRGCTLESMIEVMVKEGFTEEAAIEGIDIVKGMEDEANKDNAKKRNDSASAYTYEASHIASGNRIVLSDKTVNIAMRIKEPDIVLVDNFLTIEECDLLVEAASPKLEPSVVVDDATGGQKEHAGRVGMGMSFSVGENELVQRIESRIAELLAMPIEHGEPIQVLFYKMTGQYKPHYDFFAEETVKRQSYQDQGGQRVLTVIMYLNDVDSGGETIFPDINLSVTPKKGSVIYFSYLNSLGQTDESTLHGGAPVVAGEKWIATKWIRQGRFA